MGNRFFDEIRKLPEKGDIEKVLEKWEKIQQRQWLHQFGMPIVIPELLLYSAPGIGRSHLLRLLSEGLQDSKLLEFSGEVPFFEFSFEYCHPQEHFEELSRFQTRLEQAAGFRSHYKGIVCIELNEWLGHLKEKYFKVFFEFLEVLSNSVLLVFSLSKGTGIQKREMEQFLAMSFRLEVVHLTMPTAEEYADYMMNALRRYGFSLSEEVEQFLIDSIGELRNNPYFDGYKSIKRMLQDIVYHVLTREEIDNFVLDENSISKFKLDGEYIQQTKLLYEKREIGFQVEEG